MKNLCFRKDSVKFNFDKTSIKVFAIENLADLIDENFLIFMRKSLHKFFQACKNIKIVILHASVDILSKNHSET